MRKIQVERRRREENSYRGRSFRSGSGGFFVHHLAIRSDLQRKEQGEMKTLSNVRIGSSARPIRTSLIHLSIFPIISSSSSSHHHGSSMCVQRNSVVQLVLAEQIRPDRRNRDDLHLLRCVSASDSNGRLRGEERLSASRRDRQRSDRFSGRRHFPSRGFSQ